jgi:hypothetical protein
MSFFSAGKVLVLAPYTSTPFMKKTILSVAMLGIALNLFAQDQAKVKNSHAYIRVGGTYAFPHAGQTSIDQSQFIQGKFQTTETPTSGPDPIYTDTWDLKKASFGAGITAVLAGGYMFTNNIGIEVAASIGLSQKKYTFDDAFSYQSTSGGTINDHVKGTFYQKRPVLIMPSVVLQTGGQKLNVYSRIGIALPVAGKFIMDYERYAFATAGSILYSWSYETKTRFALGMQGALGAQVRIAKKISLYLEANGVSLNAYAKTQKMTKFSQDGVDYLYQVSTYEKEIQYDFTGTRITPNPNTTVPKQAATFSIAYSNIGIGAGLVVEL